MSKTLKKILSALKKFVTYNVGYKIMAIVFAFILWLVVVNIQNPASTRTFTNIPVEIINEESVLDGDHIYTVRSGKNATITVAGTRSVLANLSAADFEAVADFSSLSLTNAAPITVTLSSDKARYESQVDITLKTPSMVIDIEDLVTQEYPVQVHYIGNKPEGLMIDKVEIAPETLTVSAPASIAETISSVGIMVNYDDVVSNEPIEIVPNLYDSHGNEIAANENVTFSSENVAVQFITYETKTIPINIEAFGTPAEGYELTGITMSRERVQIKGSQELLDSTDSIDLPATLLNVSGRMANLTITVDLMDYIADGLSFYDAQGNSYYVVITANIEKTEDETVTVKETETATDTE